MKSSFVTVAILALVCVACTQAPGGKQQTAQVEKASHEHTVAAQTTAKEHACCSTAEAADTEISDESVYQISSGWTDVNGKEFHPADLRGKVRVVAMIFTNCAYVCPRITTDMLDMESRMSDAVRNKVGFVLFSIDPERDTQQALADYAGKMKLDPTRWTLLRSDEDAVREMAAVLGVKYKKESNGDYAHSILITVLNKEGEIVHRQEGLQQDPRTTLAVINGLVGAQ